MAEARRLHKRWVLLLYFVGIPLGVLLDRLLVPSWSNVLHFIYYIIKGVLKEATMFAERV